jgi:hypothetical protein
MNPSCALAKLSKYIIARTKRSISSEMLEYIEWSNPSKMEFLLERK